MLDEETSGNIVGIVLVWMIFVLTVFIFLLSSSCTLSLQNVSSNGKATDQVDDQQDAKADINPNLNFPLKV